MEDLPRVESLLPPGTPVSVRQKSRRREGALVSEVVGVVEEWEDRPTGSWFAHGKNGKLWLKRLKLRKVDGELSLITIDDATELAKLQAAPE